MGSSTNMYQIQKLINNSKELKSNESYVHYEVLEMYNLIQKNQPKIIFTKTIMDKIMRNGQIR